MATVSGTSSANSSTNTNQITGLMSTLDVDSLVEAALQHEQSRIDKLNKTITTAEWKTDAYKEVNSLLLDFTNKYLTSTSADNIFLPSSTNAKTAVYTQTSAMNITATSSAQVDQLSILSATVAKKAVVSSDQIKYVEDNGDGSVDALKKKMEEHGFTNLTIEEFATLTGAELKTGDDGNTVSMTINGKEFEFDRTLTLRNMMNKINSDADANVKMIYNEFTQKFDISSKKTGDSATVEISGDNGLFVGGDAPLFSTLSATGSNATVSFDMDGDGVADAERTFDSNSFVVGGISFELMSDTTQKIDVSIKTDVDGIVNKIKNFVNDYNALIDTLNAKISEERYRSFTPLTAKEKKELSESELKEWEQKAKSGLVRNDSTIRNFLSELRSTISEQMSASGLSFAAIGITTGTSYSGTAYKNKGKLEIDETKLRNAIANDPDGVSELFSKTSTATDSTQKFNESGLAYKFNSILSKAQTTITDTIIGKFGREISSAKTRISTLEDFYETKKESLYKRYAALEVALAQMNAQSSWLYN